MSLKDIKLKISYETTDDEYALLEQFYIPSLQEAVKYYRIAGFFSSTSLATAAEGIEGLISNGGKMYLLISPELSQEDYDVITTHGCLTSDSALFSEIMNQKMPEERLQALGWLLDTGLLQIKVVVRKKTNTSLFHQKIGIMFDKDGNIVSFSGSINETTNAWINNIEEFKVFCSWKDGQTEYINTDLKKFNEYWKNQRPNIAQVFDIPNAVKEKLISMKPRDISDLNIMSRYKRDKKRSENKLSLYDHQNAAVQAWIDNGRSLLFEMCTSAGKTRTAIGCLMTLIEKKENVLAIVSTPQSVLTKQWQDDFRKLGIVLDREIFADGSNTKKWREIEIVLLDLNEKKIRCGIIFTTHDTASNPKFLKLITENKFNTKVLFIGDEVHAVGSNKRKLALLDCYDYRIGLSATPERMFDEEGTTNIRKYFGHRSYEFTIEQGLTTINPSTGKPFLNRYEYRPIFIELSNRETTDYNRITNKIVKIIRSQEEDDYDEELLRKLYEKRADIGKNAENKIPALIKLLHSEKPTKIQDMILFVSPQQIKKVMTLTGEMGIKRAEVTENESTSKVVNSYGDSERQDIINRFKGRKLQMLVGIKCMDEGIDIPNARTAVLISNSTNPREYVQRVGRVIRYAPDKPISIIYDMIVYQNETVGGSGLIEKEAKRAYQIAKSAVNYEEVREQFIDKGVDLDVYQ